METAQLECCAQLLCHDVCHKRKKQNRQGAVFLTGQDDAGNDRCKDQSSHDALSHAGFMPPKRRSRSV